MVRDILIGAAGAVIAGLIVAAAEGTFGLLSSIFGPAFPPGAVVAFDGPCPEGEEWELYQLAAGRFLLASGNNRLEGSKHHELHDEGGRETHTLTIQEMPTHNHDNGAGNLLVRITGEDTSRTVDRDTARVEFDNRIGVPIKEAGGGNPHNNMPPYLVLNFCEKR